jgi:hypothetical protein
MSISTILDRGRDRPDALQQRGRVGEAPALVGAVKWFRLADRADLPDGPEVPDATSAAVPGAAPLVFLSRFAVLQAIGAAGIAGLWMAGLAQKPFAGDNAFLCWLIVGMGALGVLCVLLQRWADVQWLATHVVRIGLLGTVIGLIIAFSAARSGDTSDPSAIRPLIASVIDGMYVSLYATLLGIATNLWLKINLRLLGRIDG